MRVYLVISMSRLAVSFGNRFCVSRKGGTGVALVPGSLRSLGTKLWDRGRWVGADKMTVSGLGLEKLLVGAR